MRLRHWSVNTASLMSNTLCVVAYILMVYGLTNILVNGRGPFGLVEWFRKLAGTISPEFKKMLACMMCTSTNVGLVLSVIDVLMPGVAFTPFNLLLPASYWYLIVPFDAFLSSGATWLLNAVELWFEEKQVNLDITMSNDGDE